MHGMDPGSEGQGWGRAGMGAGTHVESTRVDVAARLMNVRARLRRLVHPLGLLRLLAIAHTRERSVSREGLGERLGVAGDGAQEGAFEAGRGSRAYPHLLQDVLHLRLPSIILHCDLLEAPLSWGGL